MADNYIWLLHNGQQALVVDPGTAEPVMAALQAHKLVLQTILVTHHHADHTGGIETLRQQTGAHVIGPAYETIPEPAQRVEGGETLELLGISWNVLSIPGHTSGHIAFYAPHAQPSPILFCGDTLFSAGCGRIFEGTPTQMHASLQSLAALPGSTRVCCAHEYTLSNLKFAQAAEPNNPQLIDQIALCEQLRSEGLPTLPTTIAKERQINPFLRCDVEQVAHGARQFAPDLNPRDPLSVFTALREWKNIFR